MADEPTTESTPLEHLEATLEAALHLTREMTGDQLLSRLLAAFRSMPLEDRGAIIEAVEREVKARKLSLATEGMTGQSMVPNRNARLYLRAHESGFDRNMLERDEMMIATVRGMRAAMFIPAVAEIYASWQDATREAMRQVDEPVRAAVEQLVQEVLRFIAEVRAEESEPPPPAADQSTPRNARES